MTRLQRFGVTAFLFGLHGSIPRAAPAPFTGLHAGGGGSELPWWSPIGVALIFALVALALRWRDRRARSGPVPPAADALESSNPLEAVRPEREDGPEPPPRLGRLDGAPARV